MRARLLWSLFLVFALAAPALAQDRRGGPSLDRALSHMRQTTPGKFYDADGPFFGANGHPTYRIKWMTPDGRMVWFNLDVQTGQVVSLPPGASGRFGNDGNRGPGNGWAGERNPPANGPGSWGNSSWGDRGNQGGSTPAANPGQNNNGQNGWGGRGNQGGSNGWGGRGNQGGSNGWGGRGNQGGSNPAANPGQNNNGSNGWGGRGDDRGNNRGDNRGDNHGDNRGGQNGWGNGGQNGWGNGGPGGRGDDRGGGKDRRRPNGG